MNTIILKKEETLQLLRYVETYPHTNQRLLSKGLNISLGKINFLIKELTKKGWVKINRAVHSENKLAYIYLLTPEGIEQKSRLTKEFLKRKIVEYDMLREEIKKLKCEIKNQS